MWQIIKRELKDKRWSLLAYCLGSLAMLWIYVATFRSSQASTQQLQALVKGYPKAFLQAFGLDTLSLNSIEIYLNAKHFSLLWPLVAIILATARAGSAFAGEIENGTMGLLLSLPLRRVKIFWAKYWAALITIFCFTAVSIFGVIPIAAAYNIPTHLHILLAAWVLITLFMWMVYSVGLAVSTVVSDKSPAYAITSSIFLVSYVMFVISLINEHLNSLKYYSIFHYFNTQEVLSSGHIAASALAVFAAIILVTTSFAAWYFDQRDISV